MSLPEFDVRKPVTNPALKLAMDTLKRQGTGAAEKLFIEELEKAHFLAPVSIDPAPALSGTDGQTILTEHTQIRFQLLHTQEGTPFFPAFTDWDELRRWSQEPNQQTIIATLEDYSSLILNREDGAQGFVINPFHENIVVPKAFLNAREGGATPYTVEKETKIILGDPAEYPVDMVGAIRCYLAGQPAVKTAWLQLMLRDKEKSYLVVVEYARGDRRKLFDGIAGAATPHLNGMALDLIALEDAFSYSAVKNKEPFYKA